MFTGIVEEVGTLVDHEVRADSAVLRIRAERVLEDVALGDSIAVNGVCLTVTDVAADGVWSTDVMAETLLRSTLGTVAPGDPVNLERAVTPQTRLGGHLVQGHVDGIGQIIVRIPGEHWEIVRIALPPELARYIVEKGSVTVDGVSLTVSAVSPLPALEDLGNQGLATDALAAEELAPEELALEPAPSEPAPESWFEVSLIPTTLRETTLGARAPGDPVNLEVDVIAKYVERLLGGRR